MIFFMLKTDWFFSCLNCFILPFYSLSNCKIIQTKIRKIKYRRNPKKTKKSTGCANLSFWSNPKLVSQYSCVNIVLNTISILIVTGIIFYFRSYKSNLDFYEFMIVRGLSISQIGTSITKNMLGNISKQILDSIDAF